MLTFEKESDLLNAVNDFSDDVDVVLDYSQEDINYLKEKESEEAMFELLTENKNFRKGVSKYLSHLFNEYLWYEGYDVYESIAKCSDEELKKLYEMIDNDEYRLTPDDFLDAVQCWGHIDYEYIYYMDKIKDKYYDTMDEIIHAIIYEHNKRFLEFEKVITSLDDESLIKIRRELDMSGYISEDTLTQCGMNEDWLYFLNKIEGIVDKEYYKRFKVI